MFNSLSGTITGKFPQKLYIETGGVEWDVTVPETSLGMLPSVGDQGRVYVWLQHTETAMTLFGFASVKDRDLFFDLNKVDGVGPRSAVKIMSSVSREQLVASLESGDLAALEKIPGLGKKTAQKMLLALKGKLTLDDSCSPAASPYARGGEYADVVSALAQMGYERRAAEECVSKLVESLSGGAERSEFAGKTKDEKEEIVFRKAIVELAQ